jgi:hypothetical protein
VALKTVAVAGLGVGLGPKGVGVERKPGFEVGRKYCSWAIREPRFWKLLNKPPPIRDVPRQNPQVKRRIKDMPMMASLRDSSGVNIIYAPLTIG